MTGVITRGKILRSDLARWDGRTNEYSRKDASGGTVTGLVADNEVDVVQVFGAGTQFTSAALARAVAFVGGESVTLVLAPGDWAITASITVPSNVAVSIPSGVDLQVSTSITLTFNGPVYADSADFYSGLGAVAINADSIIGGAPWTGRTDAEISDSAAIADGRFPEFHIHRYGAVGDGTTDDSAAWNAARSLGKIVLGGPQFTYYAPTGFVITEDDVHVAGSGSTLKMASNNSTVNVAACGEATLSIDSADGVTIEDVVIDCSNVASSNVNSRGIGSDNATNLTLRRIRFINGGQMQVLATGLIENHRYSQLRADTIGYGVLVNAPDADSFGLYIDDCEWDLQGSDQSDGVEVNTPNDPIRLVRVSRCVVKRAYGNGLSAGIGFGFAGVKDLIVSDCVAEDCSNDGFHVEDDSEDAVLSNCHAIGCANTTGATGPIAVLTNSRRVKLIGCTVRALGSQVQFGAPFAIYSNSAEYCDDIEVIGCQFNDGAAANIQISNARRVSFIGCNSYNPNRGNTSKPHIIVGKPFAQRSEDIVFQGCNFVDGSNASFVASFPDGNSTYGFRLYDNDWSDSDYYSLGTGELIEARGNKFDRTVSNTGTIAPAGAATSTTVTNANADSIARIRVYPLNGAAAGLANYVSAISRGVSFTLTHSAAAGTESFGYTIE